MMNQKKKSRVVAVLSAMAFAVGIGMASTPSISYASSSEQVQADEQNCQNGDCNTQRRNHKGQPPHMNGGKHPNCNIENGDCTTPEPPKDENGNPLPPPDGHHHGHHNNGVQSENQESSN